MSESTNRDLVRAYELIEADKHDEARVILDTYLATNKDNPDAWWLYAYAVNNPQDAQRALNNVLRLNPSYPGAKELLNETQGAASLQPVASKTTTVATPASGGIARLGSKPAAESGPDFLSRLDEDDDDDLDLDSFADDDADLDLDDDDLDDFDDDDETEVEAESQTPNRLFLFAGIGVVVLLIIAAVAGVLLRPKSTPTNVTPTTVAVGQTLEPSPTVVFNVGATSEPQETAAATQDVQAGNDFSAIYTALSSVEVVEDSAVIESTSAGQTLLVSVCSGAGRQQLSETLTTVMPLIAGEGDTLGAQADAIGVRVTDCANGNAVLRTVYVTSADAQEFAAGTITVDELRRRWKSL
jgi:hypothetical protein